MQKKIDVGILGCTGMVGQKLIMLLSNHPWFQITEIVASDNSAGKIYTEHVNWKEVKPIPPQIGKMKIRKTTVKLKSKLLFSGLDSSVAGTLEQHYAEQGHIIVSNSKNHRMDDDVPLVIPEINAEHFALIKRQKNKYDNKGFIVTNPNCSTITMSLSLCPILQQFGLKSVIVTTMQAISGAGFPGLPSLDILGNVIPYIENEEEKMQLEPLKIFGEYKNSKIKLANLAISAMCNRVPVWNGHTMTISFATTKKITKNAIIEAFANFTAQSLPSSPSKILQYFDNPLRPQPILDINAGNGMTVSIGNLRKCNVLDWKMTVVGHNTIRGAAGAAILNAEYLVKHRYI